MRFASKSAPETLHEGFSDRHPLNAGIPNTDIVKCEIGEYYYLFLYIFYLSFCSRSKTRFSFMLLYEYSRIATSSSASSIVTSGFLFFFYSFYKVIVNVFIGH
jgi:hypothetical protein